MMENVSSCITLSETAAIPALCESFWAKDMSVVTRNGMCSILKACFFPLFFVDFGALSYLRS